MKNRKTAKDEIIAQNRKINPDSKIRAELIVITWDNPKKKDSSDMFVALKKLGKVRKLYVKTTAVLWPKDTTSYDDVKETIQSELANEKNRKGRAAIISLSEDRIAHIDLDKSAAWKKGYPAN